MLASVFQYIYRNSPFFLAVNIISKVPDPCDQITYLEVDLVKILNVPGYGDVPELVRVLKVPHVEVAGSPGGLLGVQQELHSLEGLVLSTKP